MRLGGPVRGANKGPYEPTRPRHFYSESIVPSKEIAQMHPMRIISLTAWFAE
jgi:hypothetical protein